MMGYDVRGAHGHYAAVGTYHRLRRTADRPRQEVQRAREMFIAVERASSMCGPVDDVERDVEPKLFVRTHQLVCLVDRHLRVLIPMQKQEWRIATVDLENRTGKLS